MSLLNQARKDWNNLTSSGGFEVTFTFTSPDESDSIEVKGIFSDTSLAAEFDTGAFANYNSVFVSVSFSQFEGSAYPLFNASGIIALHSHTVSFTNATGQEFTYRISQAYPDNTTGMVSLQLQRKE